jgi:dTDP-glucose 4,6-dehydratase
MRVLVTGGMGFIGSAVCRYLVGSASVINVDKLTYAANPRSLDPIATSPNYHFEKADVADRGAMDAIFAKYQPSAVIHLAAESHVDRSITGADVFVNSNVIGTYCMLQAALSYYQRAPSELRTRFRFVHVSTDEVYGSADDGHFRENSPYQPSSPYAATKAASDHLAYAWYKTYGLPVVISNCSNNYGPHQFPEKLIPLTIINALAGKPIPIYGDGSNVRDWLYVEDHVAGLVSLLERGRPGEKYNFGGDGERSNLAVVEQLCDILDRLVPAGRERRSLVTFVTDRPGHDLRYAIDASKARGELAWRPRETLDSGLERTVRWYLDNRTWWQPLCERIYRGERLGLLENAFGA